VFLGQKISCRTHDCLYELSEILLINWSNVFRRWSLYAKLKICCFCSKSALQREYTCFV